MGAISLGALVVGEALVDIVRRADDITVHPGGSPANVALGLGRLGVRVALLTDLGCDENGVLVRSHLEDSGVTVLEESFSSRATSRAVASIAADGSATYEFEVSWDPRLVRLPDAAITHTGSIAIFLAPGGERVRHYLATSRSPEITLDPNIRPALLGSVAESREIFERTAALVTAVKLSDEDAGWLYPKLTPEDVLSHIQHLGPRLVAITMGSGGALLASGGRLVKVPAPSVNVVDTIGAGDTFMASLIVSLLATSTRSLTAQSLHALGTQAAHAASITVSRAGADLPTKADLVG